MPDGQKFEVVDGKLFELVEVEVDRKTHLPPPMEICPLMRVYMALEHMRLFGLEELSTLATFQEQCRLEWKEFLSLSEDDRTSKLFLGWSRPYSDIRKCQCWSLCLMHQGLGCRLSLIWWIAYWSSRRSGIEVLLIGFFPPRRRKTSSLCQWQWGKLSHMACDFHGSAKFFLLQLLGQRNSMRSVKNNLLGAAVMGSSLLVAIRRPVHGCDGFQLAGCHRAAPAFLCVFWIVNYGLEDSLILQAMIFFVLATRFLQVVAADGWLWDV